MKAYESALAISQKLAAANPTVSEFQLEVAASHGNLGKMQNASGRLTEAMQSHQAARGIFERLANANPEVTGFQSELASCHTNIGNALMNAGKPAEALAAYESSLALERKLVESNPTEIEFQQRQATSFSNLGNAMLATGKPDEAGQCLESALAIRRKHAQAYPKSPEMASGLGEALNNAARIDVNAKNFQKARDRLREAVMWQRKALEAYPAHPRYRQFLINHFTGLLIASQGLGDAAGVSEATLELAKLRDSDPAMVALDGRLAAIIKGPEQPRNEADRLELAGRAYQKSLYATAARLWADALAANPALSHDRQEQHRYNEACAAAKAGCGHGKDDPPADEPTRSKLRDQALRGLKAELAEWTTLVKSNNANARALVAQTLVHWQNDVDLAGIRDEKELTRLPESERSSFKQLWSDVDSLLREARTGTSKIAPDAGSGSSSR